MAESGLTLDEDAYQPALTLAKAKLRIRTKGQIATKDQVELAAKDAAREMHESGHEAPADLEAWLVIRLLEDVHDPGSHLSMAEPPKEFRPWLDPRGGRFLDPQREGPTWKYWARYRAYLLDPDEEKGKARTQQDVDELDAATNDVLSRIMDPQQEGRWAIHGMVVGNVQSGKTQHYTALVNKAADLGYRLIIVLAGVTNDLRWQTQMRLDKEFLGMETFREDKGGLEVIGVGHYSKAVGAEDAPEPFAWTSSSPKKGDFGTMQENLRVLLKLPKNQPVYLVVKKNKSALEKLRTHLQGVGWDRLAERPLLVIDDECDQASINTKYRGKDAKKEIEEDDPTIINGLIRETLNLFPRFAYVGYTATPFANVFIPHDPTVALENVDLYPRNFITVLDPPKNYVGAAKVFGLEPEPEYGIMGVEPLGIVSHIQDEELVQKATTPETNFLAAEDLPESLKKAVLCFFIATAAHRFRRKQRQYSTMLVHFLSQRNPQARLNDLMVRHVDDLRRSVLGNPKSPHIAALQKIWAEDYLAKTRQLVQREELPEPPEPTFEQLLDLIKEDLEKVEIKLLNSDTPHILDYRAGPAKTPPYIAIGGNKLSRGFTLEGLHTSYYLRDPDAADTLLQMGRWFGYRPGYVDLCRVFTIPTVEANFKYIANAIEQLRNKFGELARDGKPPSEFAHAVRMDPASAIRVTAQNRQKFAREVVTSMRGRIHQTLAMDVDEATLQSNLRAVDELLSKVRTLGKAEDKTNTIRHWNVPSDLVLEFMRGPFKVSSYESYYFLKDMVAQYVERKNKANPPEVTEFTVGYHVVPGGQEFELPQFGKIPISIRRHSKGFYDPKAGFMRLQGLKAPEDGLAGLTSRERDRAKDLVAKGSTQERAQLAVRDQKRGLLIFYFINARASVGAAYQGPPDLPAVGFMVAFPDNTNTNETEYTYLAGFVKGGRLA